MDYALSHLKQTASEIPEKCLRMDFCKRLFSLIFQMFSVVYEMII